MSNTITLNIAKEDAHFLSSCLNDLQTIFSKGTSEIAEIEEQARQNADKLKKIQEEILSKI